MIFIAHRGNLLGPDKETENSPDQIREAWDAGFDVEVDVRMKDGKFWLGHDFPQYEMPDRFLNSMRAGLWFHCKDFESFEFFHNLEERNDIKMVRSTYEYFWHDTDDYVRTSTGVIWVYPGKSIPSYNAVCVLPENDSGQNWMKADGVCTDWPVMYKNTFDIISNLK